MKIIAALPLLMLCSCATIVKGTTQTMAVNSAPPGASCTVDRTGVRLAAITVTPGSVLLQRNSSELVVSCSKDGFVSASKTLSSNFNGATLGNILLGGIVGVVVDASTGANFSYPEAVQVELAAAVPSLPPVASDPAVYIPGSPIRLSPMMQPVSMTMPLSGGASRQP